MKSNREYNLLFLATVLLIVLAIYGINWVDTSLTRLIVPDTPFSTASLQYDHGFAWVGPETIRLNAPSLAELSIQNNNVSVEVGKYQVQIPLVFTWGKIENIRRLSGQLTK